jgi:outer membrane PBP1 activator LpoA protein
MARMRAPLLLIALALAACSKAQADTDAYTKAEAQIYVEKIHAGEGPEQAKAELAAAREFQNKIANDPEIARDMKRHELDQAELHNSACKADPVMEGC